jgi:antitoxin component of MazEF toxin-antitoxin module
MVTMRVQEINRESVLIIPADILAEAGIDRDTTVGVVVEDRKMVICSVREAERRLKLKQAIEVCLRRYDKTFRRLAES